MPFEEYNTKPCLEIAYMLADGGRRHAEFKGGQGKTAFPGGRLEGAESGERRQHHEKQG